jgi:hypothetical protein
MKTYISVGIGDMVCIDSLLTNEERESITEIYWACKFGKDLIPLFEDNQFYPNIKNHHIISSTAGKAAMMKVESNAVNFWHFRPDFNYNFSVGRELFNVGSEIGCIDAAGMLSSGRIYNGSTFLSTAKEEDVPWNIYNIEQYKYMVIHYPTSTRPRSDIATINDKDWESMLSIARDKNLKPVIITDTLIDNVPGCLCLYRPPIKTIVSLIKYCSFYAGCDSFCAILAVKALAKENVIIKSHKQDIQDDILRNIWTQKYFLPLSPLEISRIYKNIL